MRSAPVVLALAILGAFQVAPVTIDPAIRRVLTQDLKLSAADFAEIERGKIVKRSLDSTASGEVAAVGAVRIDAPLDTFLAAFRDIVTFKRHQDVLQIGRFSDPPTAEDLAPLIVGDEDLDGRNCRVGDCGVRLPAQDLARFRREIDWTATNAKAKAAALFKGMLLAHVQAYWSGGPGRITVYEDDKKPIYPAMEFESILKSSPYVGRLLPGLPAHLTDFPRSRLAGAEDFLYWSKEKFGIAPFITVTHITIARTPSSSALIMTSKDVYSSRYFDSSLGLTIAAAEPDGGFLLVYENRSRASALKGTFSALRRSMVERRVKSSLEDSLRSIKARLEQRN
jgi:hypothetical protein